MKQVLKVVKVAMIPLIAISLIAWFSMPNVEAEPPQQDGTKCGPGVGCPENACCGQITSQTAGGCTAKGCCEGSDLYCSASKSRTPADFPKVAITGNGCCLVPGQSLQVYCTERECSGTAYMCGSGTCNDAGDPQGTPLRAYPPHCGAVCP